MRISDWSSDVCSSDLEAVAYPWHPTPQALAAACDTLIAILPGNAATRHIVDAAVLEALGPDGVFVNVARGSVVDGQALASALEDGRSEEHTSELPSLMRISYAVFCLKKQKS